MTRRLSWTALGCLFVLWTNPVLAQITSDAVKQTKQATVYLKVTTASGWFAARPSGTEDVYKIYAESLRSAEHLARILEEAREIVNRALDPDGNR